MKGEGGGVCYLFFLSLPLKETPKNPPLKGDITIFSKDYTYRT